jgi:hypothetical protein
MTSSLPEKFININFLRMSDPLDTVATIPLSVVLSSVTPARPSLAMVVYTQQGCLISSLARPTHTESTPGWSQSQVSGNKRTQTQGNNQGKMKKKKNTIV